MWCLSTTSKCDNSSNTTFCQLFIKVPFASSSRTSSSPMCSSQTRPEPYFWPESMAQNTLRDLLYYSSCRFHRFSWDSGSARADLSTNVPSSLKIIIPLVFQFVSQQSSVLERAQLESTCAHGKTPWPESVLPPRTLSHLPWKHVVSTQCPA